MRGQVLGSQYLGSSDAGLDAGGQAYDVAWDRFDCSGGARGTIGRYYLV
jgi:hypothetical protein